jgi:hypothetical protein
METEPEALLLLELVGASWDFLAESLEDFRLYLSWLVALWEEMDFYLLDTIPSSDLFFETLDLMDLGFDDLLCISEDWLS